MAAWDVAARAAGRPLCEALGARFGDAVPLYNVVTVLPTDDAVALARELVAEGYRRLQVKVGQDPEADADRLAAVRDAVGSEIVLFADANGAFTAGEARRFLRASRGLEYTLEQPCRTYAECASVRPVSDRPLVLDESIVTLDDLLRAHRERVADGVTIKLQRVGGITRAVLLRDVAAELGIEVTVEDAGGASLVTAAVTHLGLGTPERLRVHTCDFHTWVTVDHGSGLPPRADGAQLPPPGPGLGVEMDLAALGVPVVDVAA
jgi:L-alanine-DL-glutamate epimerase-like enolase superfamily enzyme